MIDGPYPAALAGRGLASMNVLKKIVFPLWIVFGNSVLHLDYYRNASHSFELSKLFFWLWSQINKIFRLLLAKMLLRNMKLIISVGFKNSRGKRGGTFLITIPLKIFQVLTQEIKP